MKDNKKNENIFRDIYVSKELDKRIFENTIYRKKEKNHLNYVMHL